MAPPSRSPSPPDEDPPFGGTNATYDEMATPRFVAPRRPRELTSLAVDQYDLVNQPMGTRYFTKLDVC